MIAHTISDWPRRASPAANTPSAEVAYAPAFALPRGSFSTPSASSNAGSGDRKPIASSTRPAGWLSSVPSIAANGGLPEFLIQWISSTRPLPVSAVVEIAKSCSPPSLIAYERRIFTGHSGHGVRSSGRDAGGSPSSSICVTDAAPSRCELPTQSAPVSPPPITITCLPAAVIGAGAPPSAATAAVAAVEVLHREVDAVELAAGDRQVARHARAGGDHDRVVLGPQLRRIDVTADVDAVLEPHALGDQLLEPALDHPLLDLEVRHAEAHEPAAGLVALVHGHGVAGAPQLLGGGQARRAGADHRHRVTGLDERRPRDHPALVEGAVDDRDLDRLDRHRVALADLQHAGRLARRRAQPSR